MGSRPPPALLYPPGWGRGGERKGEYGLGGNNRKIEFVILRSTQPELAVVLIEWVADPVLGSGRPKTALA